MADGISLLPEEYKKKEEEERKKRAKVKPDMAFHVPGRQKAVPAPPAPTPAKGPGVFARLFRRKPKPLIAKPVGKPVVPAPTPATTPKAPPATAPLRTSPPPKPAPPPPPRVAAPPPPPPAPKKGKVAAAFSSAAPGGDVLRVSLIPEEGAAQPAKRGVGLAGVIITVVISVLVVLGGYVAARAAAGAREAEIAGVDTLIAQTDARIREADLVLGEARDAGRRLTALDTLLDRHVRWTGFFTWLERNTIPTVTFTQLRSESVGTVTLDALAAGFPAAAEQIVVFRTAPQAVTAVETSAINADIAPNGEVRGVRFSVTLSLAPTLLTPDAATGTPRTAP